jgi:hypothetical protein
MNRVLFYRRILNGVTAFFVLNFIRRPFFKKVLGAAVAQAV